MSRRNKPIDNIRELTDNSPKYYFPRPPTTTDKRDRRTNIPYEVGSFALISKDPSTGIPVASGTEGDIYYLAKYDTNGDAIWRKFSSGSSGTILAILDDDGDSIVPDSSSEITINTEVIAAVSQPIKFDRQSASQGNIQVQYASAAASDVATNVGLSSFNSSHFTVSATGYVSLTGGGAAIDQIAVDANTAPGTDPVVPDGSGQITVAGAVVDNHDVPIETNSRAANAYNIEVQVSKAVTGAPGVKTGAGVSTFDDTAFAVDADGYVTLVGGSGPVTLTLTGDDATAVGPDGTGTINVTAEAVANATNAKPLYIDGDVGTNTLNAEIQVATAIGSAPGNKLDAGIASFDSADFIVDADGFVQLVNSNGPSPGPSTNYWFEDFIGYGGTTGSVYNVGWNSSQIQRVNESGHPGIVFTETLVVGSNDSFINTGTSFFLGDGEITVNFLLRLSVLSNGTDDYLMRFGLANGTSFTDGLYFSYNHATASGNWQIIANDSSTATTEDSGQAADTNWRLFTITCNAAGTSASFFIDGVEVSNSPISTNLPSAALGVIIDKDLNVGSNAKGAYVDYVEFTQNLTTARA